MVVDDAVVVRGLVSRWIDEEAGLKTVASLRTGREAIDQITRVNPDVVIPMHCSGPGFVAAVREQMPDRLITSTTGTEYLFGA